MNLLKNLSLILAYLPLLFANMDGPEPLIEDTEDMYIQNFTLYTLEESKCLDSSPMAYYLHNGDPDTLILYFYSGGYCIDSDEDLIMSEDLIDLCSQRELTMFGSTSKYPNTFSSFQGIMGTTKYQNKHFRTATKAFLMYCDGSGWHRQMNPQIFSKLLQQIGLEPKIMILSGSGPGALYLLSQANHLQEAVNQPFKLILDGAVLLIPQQAKIKKVLHEVASRVNLADDEFYSLDLFHKLRMPTFFVQSSYDWWHLEAVHNIRCTQKLNLEKCTPKLKTKIEKVRQNQLQFLKDLTQQHSEHAFWSISCLATDLLQWTESWQHPRHMINDAMLSEVVQEWIHGKLANPQIYDVSPWPFNEGCANIFNSEPDPAMEDLRIKYETQEREDKFKDQYIGDLIDNDVDSDL